MVINTKLNELFTIDKIYINRLPIYSKILATYITYTIKNIVHSQNKKVCPIYALGGLRTQRLISLGIGNQYMTNYFQFTQNII